MFEETELLGFSMVSRKSRRILVVCVYLFFAVFVLAGAVRQSVSLFGVSGLPFIVAVLLLTRYTFGRLVPNYAFNDDAMQQVDISGPEEYAITGEKPVAVRRPAAMPDPDERDLAVRNSAYFAALRIVTVFLLIVWVAIVVAGHSRIDSGRLVPVVASYGVFAALVLLLTLPQAIILWNEPDLITD